MDILIIIIGSGLMLTGIIGAFLPVLPGPPISYAGLLLLQFTSPTPFTTMFLVYWAIIVVIVMSLENFLPAVGSNRMGGSRYGVWGCIIGGVIGLFIFPPFGIIFGPMVGAFIGELAWGQTSDRALRAAIGSFIGFFVGTVIKVAVSLVLAFYFVRAAFM
ncbi:DUF456 domain-containing protein [Rhodohalobacter sp. 8-1]|uniref:DUF456 domain-containing protein n=1 Tax=Rhodohalobacter sp. 8-1 TaxID=3131972 RepID=UPI0030EEE579